MNMDQSDENPGQFPFALAEGVSLCSEFSQETLTPITRSNRRTASLCPDKSVHPAPNKKKQRLSDDAVEETETTDFEAIFYDDNFGGKGKVKSPVAKHPHVESLQIFEEQSETNSYFGFDSLLNEDIDDLVEYIVNPTPTVATNITNEFYGSLHPTESPLSFSEPEGNFENEQSTEGTITELQPASYDLANDFPTTGAPNTFTASQENCTSVETAFTNESDMLLENNGETVQQPMEVLSSDAVTFHVLNFENLQKLSSSVLIHTSECESVLVPQNLVEFQEQDAADKETKIKKLTAYCSISCSQRAFILELQKLADESVTEEELHNFIQTEAEKLQRLANYIRTGSGTVGKEENPHPKAPVLASAPAPSPPSPAAVADQTDIFVEGYYISRGAWASAYAHNAIKTSAVVLTEELLTDEEKCTVTISGRICAKEDGTKEKTPKFDPIRLNVIYHAIASMMKKNGTYYYNPDDFKQLEKNDRDAIKGGISQRLNQIKQARKKAA